MNTCTANIYTVFVAMHPQLSTSLTTPLIACVFAYQYHMSLIFFKEKNIHQIIS